VRSWKKSISAGVKNGIKGAHFYFWLPFKKPNIFHLPFVGGDHPAITDHLVIDNHVLARDFKCYLKKFTFRQEYRISAGNSPTYRNILSVFR